MAAKVYALPVPSLYSTSNVLSFHLSTTVPTSPRRNPSVGRSSSNATTSSTLMVSISCIVSRMHCYTRQLFAVAALGGREHFQGRGPFDFGYGLRAVARLFALCFGLQ